jgi:hypothetical protein
MNAVILQSNYLPWKGYFDLIHDADLFIFLDDVQYTHDDWRNRNKIMTLSGPRWLTIPAGRNNKRLICEVEIQDQDWKKMHRRLIEQHYSKAPYFKRFAGLLDFLYDNDLTNLSDYNQRAIKHIAGILGIRTEFIDSRALQVEGRKTERLIQVLTKVGARKYISGPAAKDYIDDRLFDETGIELVYKRYPAYPPYDQFGAPECVHQVSILDLFFHVGDAAPQYIWDSEAAPAGADPARDESSAESSPLLGDLDRRPTDSTQQASRQVVATVDRRVPDPSRRRAVGSRSPRL